MAEDVFKEDKTEKATGKKRSSLRQKGQVIQSPEINHVAVLLIGVLVLYALRHYMMNNFLDLYRVFFYMAPRYQLNIANASTLTIQILITYVKLLGPFSIIIMIVGVGASYAQVGWLWTFEPMRPKWGQLQPKLSQLNFFKKDKFVNLLVNLCKLFIVAPIVYKTVKSELANFIPLVNCTIYDTWVFVMMLGYKIVLRVCILLLFIAAADYAWKWWKHEEEIKMTKEEIKQEHKDEMGDPTVKSWQKKRRFEVFRRIMMTQVPKADVVITNPTEYAVALKYDELAMRAPQVVAKGMRKIAQKIKEIAREHGVPIVENKPLAQALYHDVELGEEVPAPFYKAVAEVLAYVFNLKKRKFQKT
jgi:flagellar biosynthesis protein FlhB